MDGGAANHRTRQRPWKRDTLLYKLGGLPKEVGHAWHFVKITGHKTRQPVNRNTVNFELLQAKPKDAQERAGQYLLRAFVASDQADTRWEM